MALWEVPPIWEGGECWIIGGGPSMPRQFGVPEDIIRRVMEGHEGPSTYSPFLSPIHGKHVIAINNAYLIGSWIDVMFFGDCKWYPANADALSKFPGLKLTSCARFKKPHEICNGIRFLAWDHEKGFGISTKPDMVAWNLNSGAASVSIAHHLGVKRIILLGFDMKLDEKKKSHWHGAYGTSKNPKMVPHFQKQMFGFEFIARDAQSLGIEIINASPDSAITHFPKITVKELLS